MTSVASSCAAQKQDQSSRGTTARANVERMNIPVSPKGAPVAPWPRPSVQEYIFRVRSSGGPVLGDGVKEFDWTMEIDSKRGLVTVESFRSDADVPGLPMGLFRFSADDGLLAELLKLIDDARLGAIKPAMAGHPGSTERLYEIVQPKSPKVEVRINNSDEATNSTIQPLRNRLNSLLARSFTHPERAVKTELMHDGERFSVTVTNIGVEPVRFVDPRAVVSTGPTHRAVVLVTDFPETKPGDAPPLLDWKEVALEPIQPKPAREPQITLEPGKTWKAQSAAFKRAKGTRYLAFFTWANYGGDQMPDGIYRIRGRVDSPRLVVNPE